MPIYEFQCDACQKPFEVLVPSAGTKVTCPECGSSKVTKQFSAFAAHGSPAAPNCATGACPASLPGGTPCCGGGSCPL